MKAIHKRRLLLLAAFLRKLPRIINGQFPNTSAVYPASEPKFRVAVDALKFAESLKALAALAKNSAVVLEFYGGLSPFKVTVSEPIDGYTVEAMFAPCRVP